MTFLQQSLAPRDGAQELTPDPGCAQHHFVQFYESDEYLCDTVADFLGDGLRQGQPVVVLSTVQHRTQLRTRLFARGFDLEQLTRTGHAIFLDVHECYPRSWSVRCRIRCGFVLL